MQKIAEKITECLIKNNVVLEERRSEYEYGFEVIGLKFINYGTIILLALAFQLMIPTLFFLLCFVMLRGRTGGYHAESALSCYIGTVILYVVVSRFIIPIIGINYMIWALMMIASSIIIVLFSPLNNEKISLSKIEFSECKKSVRWLILLFMLGIGIAIFIRINSICIIYAISGVALDAILLVIGKVSERIRLNCLTNGKQVGVTKD